jgi:hypothetical protein
MRVFGNRKSDIKDTQNQINNLSLKIKKDNGAGPLQSEKNTVKSRKQIYNSALALLDNPNMKIKYDSRDNITKIRNKSGLFNSD